MKQEKVEWQWHQLDHMQIICTSLQTHFHNSTSSLNFCMSDAFVYGNDVGNNISENRSIFHPIHMCWLLS